jgi:UDP-N-acetylglucosamine:LPS N-acetylglucosamine transferase
MIELMPAFKGHPFYMITYDSVRTRSLPNAYLIDNFPTNPSRIPRSMMSIVKILLRQRPQLVVSTGAEIAIPVFLVSKLLGITTVFVETAARVKSPSGTGRLVYHLTDYFFVQWKELLGCYGRRARYVGGLL